MTLNVRAFLDADEQRLRQSFEQAGPMRGLIDAVGQRLSGPGQAAVSREVTAAADNLLELDLGTMLIAGWRTYDTLRTAARSTLADPRTAEVVQLASHRMTSTYEPRVDLYVNDQKVYQLQLTLSGVFEVHSLTATVRAAHLVALQCGRCDTTITLSWPGGTLLRREGQIDPPLVVPIGTGIPLLADADGQLGRFRGSAPVNPAGSEARLAELRDAG